MTLMVWCRYGVYQVGNTICCVVVKWLEFMMCVKGLSPLYYLLDAHR